MRICYFGTAQFSADILSGLLDFDDLEILACVSQVDAIVGRKKELKFPEVKELAIECGIEVFQPKKLKPTTNTLSEEKISIIDTLKSLNLDFIVVVAYGKIIPKEILDIPKYGCINLHGSLLPKYRGASPVQESVKNGDIVTGLTSMYMSEGMDEGDILMQEECPIFPADCSSDIFQKFSQMGPSLLHRTLTAIMNGALMGSVQNEETASYCGKISKDDAKVSFQNMTAQEIYNRYRAFTPWPGIFTNIDGEILKLKNVSICEHATDGKIGELIMIEKGRYGIICGDSRLLELHSVQRQGKKESLVGDFINGNQSLIGYIFS